VPAVTLRRMLATPRSDLRRQSGSFLLEALIAILIVALGVLGSVGLLAHSMQEIDDARNRGEAAFLADQLIAQMWVSDRVTATLDANFSSTAGTGAQYLDFVAQLNQRLPNSALFAQDVVVAAGPNNAVNGTNSLVTVTVRWLPSGECTVPPTCTGGKAHVYNVTASIGANR